MAEMKEKFSIDFEWLGQDTEDPESATFAALKIEVADKVVTTVEDVCAKTVRHSIRASAYHLAEWFAENWWKQRWEPENDTPEWKMAHCIGTVGGGYVWPDASIASDGLIVSTFQHPTRPLASEPVRYLNDFAATVSASLYESVIDGFVSSVIERLHSCKMADTPLELLWKEVNSERTTPDLCNFRKLEALMGFDAGDGNDEQINALLKKTGIFGPSAIEEVAVLSHGGTPQFLEKLKKAAEGSTVRMKVHELGNIRSQISSAIRGETPWQRGASIAKLARQFWNLGEKPVASKKLAELFDLPSAILEDKAPENAFMTVGLRDNENDELKACLDKKWQTGRRFSLARLAGDHIYSEPQERLLPATNSKTARQKFQRAFAQELLCPFDSLCDFLGAGRPSNEKIEAAAAKYQVSPMMIVSTLVNRDVLDKSALMELQSA